MSENEQGKDSEFKENINLVPTFDRVEDFSAVFPEESNFYRPDAVFKKDDTVVILESSTTNDRKVHIGELIQFLTFVKNDKKFAAFYFVLFLAGDGEKSPKQDKEIERLQHYFDCYQMQDKMKAKIKKIAIAKQPQKEELGQLTIERIKSFDGLSLN